MAGENRRPIFTEAPIVKLVSGIAAALSAANLTGGTLGTNVFEVITAQASRGSYARGVMLKAQPLTATVASIARLYINNGSTIATAANSAFLREIQLPATVASTTIQTPEFWLPVEEKLQAGYRVLLCLSVWSTGAFDATGFSSDY